MYVNYATDISLMLGGLINIVGYIIMSLIIDLEINIFLLFLNTFISVLISFIIKFFDIMLDYKSIERVSFEDDENYYYVKIVPKITFFRSNKTIKRFYIK